MTQLYSLRSTPAEGEYTIMKFDGDYHCEAVYAVNKGMCSGPDGHRPKCKHREMLRIFLELHHVDDGWFYDWHTRMWRKPFAEAEYKAEKAIADAMTMGNGKPSDTPLLGSSERSDAAHQLLGKPKSEEDALAERIAPAFASEGAGTALSRPVNQTTAVEPPASPRAPVVAPPPAAKSAASPAGGGTIRRRKV